ncbi:hypothetical protein M9Y10_005457 [Tritrichomonas musculus]|uniref:Uncharacterized protein n=1 Tax=Tritrichomonas musculus TaxID=1915356 RepID=A0ABR2JMQ1_9EUKA
MNIETEFQIYISKLSEIYNKIPREPKDHDSKEYDEWLKEKEKIIKEVNDFKYSDKIPGTKVSRCFNDGTGQKEFVWGTYEDGCSIELTDDVDELLKKQTEEENINLLTFLFGFDVSKDTNDKDIWMKLHGSPKAE